MPKDSEPIPEISEAEATGDIAALYEDLRASLGIPFVNLIWRHLATIPNGLAWTWTLLRPLYVSGELERRSAKASELVSLPAVVALPDCVWESAAVDREARQTIVRVIESYDRGNGANFLALFVARSVLGGGRPAASAAKIATPEAGSVGPSPPALPPLPRFSDFPPHVLTLVRRLDQFGRVGDNAAIASLYRHLALWPGFLSVAYAALEPLHRSGELAKAQAHLIEFGEAQCAELLGLADRDLPAITAESRAQMFKSVDEFVRLMIGRMIVMGKAMGLLIPPDGSNR